MEEVCQIDAGARVAQHAAFGVASQLCEALKAYMRNESYAPMRVGDGGMVVTTSPMGTLGFFIAQAWADGWLRAYEDCRP